MLNNKFDVLIPSSSREVSFLPCVVSHIRKNIVGCDCIYIVTKQKNHSKIHKTVKDKFYQVIDEDRLIEGLSYQEVYKYIDSLYGIWSARRTGWYFQQIIKYAFALSNYANKYYLTWDADTLPLRPLTFFDNDRPYFTIKREYHPPYFETSMRLCSIGKKVDYSFIAEHMLFNTFYVKQLIHDIQNVGGDEFWKCIIRACDIKDPKGSYFSEFELYGNYCTEKYPTKYKTRRLNTFRGAGMIRGRFINEKISEILSLDLDTASFEKGHFLFPYNIPFNLNRIVRRICFEFNKLKKCKICAQ